MLTCFRLTCHPFCCTCRVSWWCRATGGAAAGAEGGEATALRPVGRCQLRLRRPKKPTWWQVQPHSGLRPLVCFFSFERFFYFLKINTPTTLPPHQPVTFFPPSSSSHALVLSCPRTPVSSPSTLKPFVLILFSIKRRKLLTKALYVSLSPLFPFSPSCSALRLLGKAWRLACPSFLPVVNGKGKNNKKDLMRGFLNTIKIDMNSLWLILVCAVIVML